MGMESILGVASSALGMFGGGGGGGGGGGSAPELEPMDPAFIAEYEQKAYGFLDNALRNALPYSEFFTEKAMDEMNQKYDQARLDAKSMYEQSKAFTAPYREAGYQALDTYQDTLGMARPKSGSSKMYHAQENLAKENAARAQLGLQASITAKQMGMSPEDTLKFSKAATLGNNEYGMNRALQQLELGGGAPGNQSKLAATLSERRPGGEPTPYNAEGKRISAEEAGFTPYEPYNPYSNTQAATQGRFNQANPRAAWSGATSSTYGDLTRAMMAMSGADRALANTANTGY